MTTVDTTGHAARPRSVTLAAICHVAVALAFLVIPLVGLVYGAEVQAAAEAETARQGQDPSVLSAAGLHFDETGSALWAPLAIAAVTVLPGLLLLAGKRIGRTLAWIVMPLVLIGNVLIMASNASAATALQALFDESSDAALQHLDAAALLDAAYAAYPGWLPVLEAARLVVVVSCCLAAPALLTTKSARSHLRGR